MAHPFSMIDSKTSSITHDIQISSEFSADVHYIKLYKLLTFEKR